MKNFQRDNRAGGWKSTNKFGAKKPWERNTGGRDARPDERHPRQNDIVGLAVGRGDRPTLHKATCSECGQSCEVPFKPNGRKPVFCSNCFKREEGPAPRFGDRDQRRQSFGEKRLYQAVCDTCGNTCEVPFRPTGEKPIYCRQCFVKPEGKTNYVSAPRTTEDYKDHFRMINKKLDAILKVLSPAPTPVAAPDEGEESDVFSFEMPKEKRVKKSGSAGKKSKKRTV